jgi:hypothetical protein
MSPPHADSMELWLKIFRKYDGLVLKPWAKNPTASATFRSLGSVFESTISTLPNIHTLWLYLAKLDAVQLVKNTVELWAKDIPQIPMIAITCACNEIDVTTFLNILKQNAEFLRSVAEDKDSIMTTAAVEAAKRFAIASPHRIDSLAAALASALSTKPVSNFIATLNDEQTLEAIAKVEGMPFHAYMQLLWGQIHRDSLEDLNIVKTLFRKVLELKEEGNEEQTSELNTFFSQVVGKVTGDGTAWLSLLADTEPIPVSLFSDEATVLKQIGLVVLATRELHAKCKIEHEIKDIKTVDELIEVSLELIASGCEFCQTVARYLIASAFPILSDEQFEKVSEDPYVLVKASVTKKFCKVAIPKMIANSKKLPRSILNYSARLQIDADSETATEILLSIIEKAPSNNAFIANIFTNLIGKLTEEKKKEFAGKIMKHNFNNLSKKETDFIVPYIKNGKQAAEYVLDSILESAKAGEDSAAFTRRYRLWLEEACKRHELDAEKIGHALEKIADFPAGDSKQDKSKQEDTSKWLASFLVQQKRYIPLFNLLEKVKSLEHSKSLDARKYGVVILNTQNTETVDEEGEAPNEE